MTRGPNCSATPAPRDPYMPTACTSSIKVSAPYLCATSQIASMGEMAPDMEYTDSNATIYESDMGSYVNIHGYPFFL